MLAGLQSEVDSLFPKLRTIVPDDAEAKAGADRLKFGRLIELSGYKTEIFDMHSAKERAAYDRRMLSLSKSAQVGSVRILQHDRQIMTRKDGSTGWFAYLEWMEYTRKDDSVA